MPEEKKTITFICEDKSKLKKNDDANVNRDVKKPVAYLIYHLILGSGFSSKLETN